MKSDKRWEVRQWTVCDGWVNNWSIEIDGVSQPHTFATAEEAQHELDEHLRDIADEITNGERDEDQGYDRNEFMIVPVGL